MTADAILKKPAGWFGKRLGNKLGTLRRVARTAFDLRHENTEGVRELVTLVEHRYGHRETSLKGISLDRNGDPTPWYTYSAIDYLKQLDFSEKDVFEYGCGASTLFWSVRARSVTSVDDDEAWFARIARQVGPHRTVLLETERERYIGAIQKKSEGYDVIVIDGKHRLACAQVARRSLKPGGMIVVDNSDWYTNTTGFLRQSGMIQVDFTGIGPVVYFPWCTSVFLDRQADFQPRTSLQPEPGTGTHPTVPEDDFTVAPEPGKSKKVSLDGITFDAHILPAKSYSYALHGEDMLAFALSGSKRGGFYVDVGAHHPLHFSNTELLYRRGWRGINIEPSPDGISMLEVLRPRDINVRAAVSNGNKEMTYYVFEQQALNSFDRELVGRYVAQGHRVINQCSVQAVPLAKVLREHVALGQEIDFMNVDVEGMEHEVLVSNDWTRFSPRILAVEELDTSLEDAAVSRVSRFLKQQGYEMCCRTPVTSFFKKRNPSRA